MFAALSACYLSCMEVWLLAEAASPSALHQNPCAIFMMSPSQFSPVPWATPSSIHRGLDFLVAPTLILLLPSSPYLFAAGQPSQGSWVPHSTGTFLIRLTSMLPDLTLMYQLCSAYLPFPRLGVTHHHGPGFSPPSIAALASPALLWS